MTLTCEKPSIDSRFGIHEHEFCGIPSYLIIPAIDAKWNENNLNYRSLIINKKTSDILSCGWPKFFNSGENPIVIQIQINTAIGPFKKKWMVLC